MWLEELYSLQFSILLEELLLLVGGTALMELCRLRFGEAECGSGLDETNQIALPEGALGIASNSMSLKGYNYDHILRTQLFRTQGREDMQGFLIINHCLQCFYVRLIC
jgi:hypothetical protein